MQWPLLGTMNKFPVLEQLREPFLLIFVFPRHFFSHLGRILIFTS